MLTIKGMPNNYAERAQLFSICFCYEKCQWALGLGNLCFHRWLLSKGRHLTEGFLWHEADTMVLKSNVTEAILDLLSSERLT